MAPHDRDPVTPPGMTPERAQSVLDFVDKLYDNRHDLELDDGKHGELEDHIYKVRERLGAGASEHSAVDDIVDEALVAMHRLVSSSTTQKAAELLQEAGRFLTGVG